MLRLAHRTQQACDAEIMQRIHIQLAGNFRQIVLSRNKLPA